MNDDELTGRLHTAFSLIAKLAGASQIILNRLAAAEATIAILEADAMARKADEAQAAIRKAQS